MILRIHMLGREPWEKEINNEEDCSLNFREPPPDGNATVVAIEFEGYYEKIPGGFFNKTFCTQVSLTWKNFQDVVALVTDEIMCVKEAPLEELPILMGQLLTESGKKSLAKRLEEGK